jgi:tetratricopeptide (TPR) repeat protein
MNVQPLYLQALDITERALGPAHPGLAVTLNSVAAFYQHDGYMKQAEKLFKRALAIQQQALGPRSPAVAATLANLSRLYSSQHKRRQTDEVKRKQTLPAGRLSLLFDVNGLPQ